MSHRKVYEWVEKFQELRKNERPYSVTRIRSINVSGTTEELALLKLHLK
jgi:hypothetical protein